MHQNVGNCIYFFQRVLGEDAQTPAKICPPHTQNPADALRCMQSCVEGKRKEGNVAGFTTLGKVPCSCCFLAAAAFCAGE